MPKVPTELGRDFFGSLDEPHQAFFSRVAESLLNGQLLNRKDLAVIMGQVDYPVADRASAAANVFDTHKARCVMAYLGVDLRLSVAEGKRAYRNAATEQPPTEAVAQFDVRYVHGMPEQEAS